MKISRLLTFFKPSHDCTRGMYTEALAFAEKAYSLAPSPGSAMGLLAGLLVRTGNRSRAEELLQKIGDGQHMGAAGICLVLRFMRGNRQGCGLARESHRTARHHWSSVCCATHYTRSYSPVLDGLR